MANKSSLRSFWFLILFALPFAGIGVFAGYLAGSSLTHWTVARSWERVPAHIITADLSQSRSDGSATYRVSAAYEYAYGGRSYVSHRVGFGFGSDNIGSFHQDAYAELRRYLNADEPFRCFVNPANPAEAVLYRQLRWGMLGFELLFALLFGGVGLGLVLAAFYGRRCSAAAECLRRNHPGQPWLWRQDWLEGRVPAGSRGRMITALVFATVWNLVSSPLIFVIPRELGDGNRAALIAVLFPAVGVALIVWAVRATLQWRRFGRSQFEMAATPGVLGGFLQGRIQMRLPVAGGAADSAADGVTLTLSCIRRVTSGSGRNRSAQDRVLWQDSYRVSPVALESGPRGASAPVRFAIPFEAGPGSAPDEDEPVRWQLEADAELPGVDYEARFTVPVFRTPESDPGVELDSAGAAAAPVRQLGPVLQTAGIVREASADGDTAYVFARARAKGPVLGLSLFTALWCGVIWLLIEHGAPILFPIVFGLSAVLFLLLLAQMLLRETRVRIGPGRLTFSKRWLASGKRFVFAAADIASIQASRGLQAGNKLYYQIVLETRAGKRYRLASLLADQRLAQALVREFETVLAS